jgi:hypothetical protein
MNLTYRQKKILGLIIYLMTNKSILRFHVQILDTYKYEFSISRPKKKLGFDYLPARGELGGESTAAEDPARTAEYTTDKTVVTNPKVREPVETAFECL